MGAKAEVSVSMDTNAMGERVLDSGLIRVVGLTPANAPEASVTTEINADLERQLVT